jgi:hypothetical protein
MKHKKDMTLEYLDGKINRLKQEFRDWERARIHWERERDERLEKLEEKFKNEQN